MAPPLSLSRPVINGYPAATLRDLIPLFFHRAHREKVLARVTNPDTRRFWTKDYPAVFEASRKEPALSLVNKIDTIVSSPIARFLCQQSPRIDFKDTLQRRGIILLNLHIPSIGDEAAIADHLDRA
jgi:hypothetical protein